MKALFHQPYSRLKTIGDAVGKTSRTTLNKYIDELIQAKIITPKKEGNDVFYLNDDLIRIAAVTIPCATRDSVWIELAPEVSP